MYAKESRCEFSKTSLECLGDIISTKGVLIDPTKIQAIQEWPVPMPLEKLCGFLGLASFYHRFL
jgi:hypothetical protein